MITDSRFPQRRENYALERRDDGTVLGYGGMARVGGCLPNWPNNDGLRVGASVRDICDPDARVGVVAEIMIFSYNTPPTWREPGYETPFVKLRVQFDKEEEILDSARIKIVM